MLASTHHVVQLIQWLHTPWHAAGGCGLVCGRGLQAAVCTTHLLGQLHSELRVFSERGHGYGLRRLLSSWYGLCCCAGLCRLLCHAAAACGGYRKGSAGVVKRVVRYSRLRMALQSRRRETAVP